MSGPEAGKEAAPKETRFNRYPRAECPGCGKDVHVEAEDLRDGVEFECGACEVLLVLTDIEYECNFTLRVVPKEAP